jgi:lipopolysaccharide biosynthesis regulator YciM
VALFGRLRRKGTPVPASTRATGHMRNALHLVLAGDLSGAELALAEAAKVDSSSADVYMALANLYRARGEVGRAIQIHQNVLLRPDLDEHLRREALLGLALDFRAGGFLKRSQASFEELLEVDPGNQQALVEIERIRIETGDWEEAIRIRRRIGGRDPDTSRVLAHLWTGHGRGLLAGGDKAGARKAFKRALSHDASCAEAYVELAEDRMREGKPKKAIGLWLRALPLHDALARVLYPRLHAAFEASNDVAGFERLLLERTEQNPEELEARIWIARAIIAQGRIDEGLARLRWVLDRAPAFLPAYAEIGATLLRERRDIEAVKTFEELLGHLPFERVVLRCADCGTQDNDLHWRCPQCGAWDSFA